MISKVLKTKETKEISLPALFIDVGDESVILVTEILNDLSVIGAIVNVGKCVNINIGDCDIWYTKSKFIPFEGTVKLSNGK